MPLNQLWLHTAEGIGDHDDEADGDRCLGHDDYNTRMTLPVYVHMGHFPRPGENDPYMGVG